MMACSLPPPGWRCTRTAGHHGPCAAVKKPFNIRRYLDELRRSPKITHRSNEIGKINL